MPCSNNGRFPDSQLAPIKPYGRLLKPCAYAWEAGPAKAGLEPTGPELSTYRDLPGQNHTWAVFQAGGPPAAVPGTSEHGCGRAVDLKLTWMRSWIDDHGARFKWFKTEAFSEWWHVNCTAEPGDFPGPFKVLKHGMKGKRVVWYTKRLTFIHPKGKKHGYLSRNFWKYKDAVVDAVKDFQRDQGLEVDGKIGEETAHRISAVFHKQYVARNKRKRIVRDHKRKLPQIKTGGRKRRKRDIVLLRP